MIQYPGPDLFHPNLAYHVLDTMISMDEAMTRGETVLVASTVEPIPAVDEDWNPYEATLQTTGGTTTQGLAAPPYEVVESCVPARTAT